MMTGPSNREEPRGERLWSGMFILAIAAGFACFMVGQGLNSSTSVYVSLYGGTATYAGVLAAVFSADVMPASRMGEGIGYAGLGQALAMTVGPTLALFLVSTDPAENLFWGLGGVGGLALVWGIANDAFGFGVTICCVICCIAASVLAARLMYPAPSAQAKAGR